MAVAVGLYDQSALSRHFKRAYGVTPRQYTEAMDTGRDSYLSEDGSKRAH